MRIFLLIIAVVLTGCTAPVTWEYPGLDPVSAERQREIDSAECVAVAMRDVSLPAQPPQTNVTVNVQGFDQSQIGESGHMTMTGTEAQAESIWTDALMQAETERRALANACMLRRG
jgi:hypothetical protein